MALTVNDAEEKNKLRQKIAKQIGFLQGCQEQELAPLSIYEFAKLARDASIDILDAPVKDKMVDIVDGMGKTLQQMDDVTQFKQLFDSMDEIYDEFPITADLARVENIVSNIQKGDFSNKVELTSRIKQIADELIVSYKEKDSEQEKIVREKLVNTIYRSVSFVDTPTGYFERDVRF